MNELIVLNNNKSNIYDSVIDNWTSYDFDDRFVDRLLLYKTIFPMKSNLIKHTYCFWMT